MRLEAQRKEMRDRLSQAELDVLIVGGGIVGAGIARDAAMRGLKTALVEQNDFASGTSSRSSRLLHGGMRYLAQGRIGLVREASVEKKVVHRIAPHLAEALPFVFPTYANNRNWKLWQLKIGVKLYDLLCGLGNFGPAQWLNASQSTSQAPGLSPEGLQGSVRYFDAFTNDARLVLDTLRSAGRAGGLISNYCRFENAARGEGNAWLCELKDSITGGPFQLRAKAIINATGPWAQKIPHSSIRLRLTKGVHLVLPKDRMPLDQAVVMTEEKRILFVIPWGDRTILGTTDTDYTGTLDHIVADKSDIEYVLQVTNSFFPKAKLRSSDVISTWAGVRPLLAQKGDQPSDISRSHVIRNPEEGWWDVAGGKLTTYRRMAEQAVDKVSAWLGKQGRYSLQRCRTNSEPLLPAAAVKDTSSLTPPPFNKETVLHFCRNEWAVHLEDVMIRRSSWHYYFREAPAMGREAAGWMQAELDWSDTQREAEVLAYFNHFPEGANRTGLEGVGQGL